MTVAQQQAPMSASLSRPNTVIVFDTDKPDFIRTVCVHVDTQGHQIGTFCFSNCCLPPAGRGRYAVAPAIAQVWDTPYTIYRQPTKSTLSQVQKIWPTVRPPASMLQPTNTPYFTICHCRLAQQIYPILFYFSVCPDGSLGLFLWTSK